MQHFYNSKYANLKGVFTKNEREYRLTPKNRSLLILLLSFASIMRKLLNTALITKNVASTQILKVATLQSDHFVHSLYFIIFFTSYIYYVL